MAAASILIYALLEDFYEIIEHWKFTGQELQVKGIGLAVGILKDKLKATGIGPRCTQQAKASHAEKRGECQV